MSLAIDVTRVEAILLSDGWHHVSPRTFELDTFQLVTATEEQQQERQFDVLYPSPSGPAPMGFTFIEQDSITGDLRRVGGPVTSVIALRYTTPSVEEAEEVDEYTVTYGQT
jgi:hypothetical protein